MKKIGKKGQVVNSTIATIVAIVVGIFVIFALFFGISSLNPTSFFSTGSAEANSTQALQTNTTQLASNFSQRLPQVGTMFGIALIIAVLLIVVLYVMRMKSASSGGGEAPL